MAIGRDLHTLMQQPRSYWKSLCISVSMHAPPKSIYVRDWIKGLTFWVCVLNNKGQLL